jgi:hypothetical protein
MHTHATKGPAVELQVDFKLPTSTAPVGITVVPTTSVDSSRYRLPESPTKQRMGMQYDARWWKRHRGTARSGVQAQLHGRWSMIWPGRLADRACIFLGCQSLF